MRIYYKNKTKSGGLLLAMVLIGMCSLIAGHLSAEVEPRIVATTGMIADSARQLVAGVSGVDGLMSEGVDPHAYRATRKDLILLDRADLIFYNGLHLEGRMGDVLQRLKRRGRSVHAIAEAVFSELDREPLLEDAGELDPHIWMDVNLWREAVVRMADLLVQQFPQHTEKIRSNQVVYDADLALLHRYASEVLATIPPAARVLVTAHDAFGYLGKAYGMEVRGIQGISTESEAGLRDIVELIDFIIARQIPAIFVETSVADKNVRALIEGAGARGYPLIVGGELFSDAMGPRGHWTGSYIGMLDHNISTIAAALGGKVPAGGFRQWRKNP
jgi:manganese/zinc/iron transport system substrate-binding protein